MTDSYFGPESITWRLYREPLSLIGGVRALLLQVAHPSVADGVARYSHFKSDPFGRGYRTFAAMAMIYFGARAQAEQTAQRLGRMHGAIQGQVPQPYSANQPDLLLWVFATLTDTTLRVYGRMPLKGLPTDWREQFYEESKIAAQLLGIPEQVYPRDLQAFERYMQGMLASDLLGSHPVCAEIAQAIVAHPYAPKKLANLLATGWLPAPLCERLGIRVAPNATERLDAWIGRFFWIYQCIPPFFRWSPAYHQAIYRIAITSGARPNWTGRFFNWLAKRVHLPMGLEVAK